MFLASLLILAASPIASLDGGPQSPMQQVETTRTAPQGETLNAPAVTAAPGPVNKAADVQARPSKASSRKGTFLLILGVISSVLGVSVLS